MLLHAFLLLQQLLSLNLSRAQTVLVSSVNLIILEEDKPFEVRNENLEVICASSTTEGGDVDVSVLNSQAQLPFSKLLCFDCTSSCSVDVGILHSSLLYTGPPNPPSGFTFTITATSVNVSWLSPSQGTVCTYIRTYVRLCTGIDWVFSSASNVTYSHSLSNILFCCVNDAET